MLKRSSPSTGYIMLQLVAKLPLTCDCMYLCLWEIKHHKPVWAIPARPDTFWNELVADYNTRNSVSLPIVCWFLNVPQILWTRVMRQAYAFMGLESLTRRQCGPVIRTLASELPCSRPEFVLSSPWYNLSAALVCLRPVGILSSCSLLLFCYVVPMIVFHWPWNIPYGKWSIKYSLYCTEMYQKRQQFLVSYFHDRIQKKYDCGNVHVSIFFVGI